MRTEKLKHYDDLQVLNIWLCSVFTIKHCIKWVGKYITYFRTFENVLYILIRRNQFYIKMSRHKIIHILTLLQIVLAPICVRGQQNTPTICLETGACYKGSWKIYGTLKYASFQGIRYAQAPVGNLRFKLPLPYYDTEGVYDVSKDIGTLTIWLTRFLCLEKICINQKKFG